MKKDFIVRRSITVIEGIPHVETYSEQELVRCKDCIHKSGLNHCPHNNDIWVADDWFCADGVKRDE